MSRRSKTDRHPKKTGRRTYALMWPGSERIGVLAGLAILLGLLPTILAAQAPPKVARILSNGGEACFVRVLHEADGTPVEVLNLGHFDAQLCATIPAAEVDASVLRRALEVAATQTEPPHPPDAVETLSRETLSARVLPPVPISMRQLDAGERFIVGLGYNYAAHADEVGADQQNLLVFPKVVEPTGAYHPVTAGRKLGDESARRVLLLDYEAELAMVLLRDLNLGGPLPDYAELMLDVAFFAANDVSNRGPIIMDDEFGFARGKSHPTYLPTGPWLVHGAHLQPKTSTEGEDRIELELEIRRHCPDCVEDTNHPDIAQQSTTVSMTRGPLAIFEELARRHAGGERVCMRDGHGVARYTATPDGIIPAGSVILTGTPSGTAIQRPGLWDRLALFVTNGFSFARARRDFIAETEEHIDATRYLQPGDEVHTQLGVLGQQIWTVRADESTRPFGVIADGECDTAL